MFVLYGLVCLAILVFAGFVSLFSMQGERITDDGTLQVEHGGFPVESYWHDYERVSFWGRKPSGRKKGQEFLEYKYGCEFTIDYRGYETGKIWYIPKNKPDIMVSVYDGHDGTEPKDDYAERFVSAIFYEGMSQCNIACEGGDAFLGEPYAEFHLYVHDSEHVYQAIQEQIPIIEEAYLSDDEYKYDAKLTDVENHFEMTYDAKGKPYAILGEGQKQLGAGKLARTRKTLVYDQTSQNGRCELFVYYEEKYDLEGNPLDSTSILDMYAIDKESHAVYPSGKHAWGDVGDTVYREATGE